MRFSINIPNFGDFADARTVARVATAAEDAGWDGISVWTTSWWRTAWRWPIPGCCCRRRRW